MEENKKYLTVEALTKYLKYRFDHDKNLNQVYVIITFIVAICLKWIATILCCYMWVV